MDIDSAMDHTLSALRAQLAEAMAIVSSTLVGFGLFGSQSAKDAALGALRMDSERITRLDLVLKPQVMAGTFPKEKWLAIAQVTSDDIRAQTGNVQGSTGFGAFWDAVVVKSAVDLKETVTDIAPWALGGLAVYGLVALAIALFLFRAELRGLAGGAGGGA